MYVEARENPSYHTRTYEIIGDVAKELVVVTLNAFCTYEEENSVYRRIGPYMFVFSAFMNRSSSEICRKAHYLPRHSLI